MHLTELNNVVPGHDINKHINIPDCCKDLGAEGWPTPQSYLVVQSIDCCLGPILSNV
jgi:hypothetical protein